MLRPLDIVVIVVYLIAIAAFGVYMGGKQSSTRGYYLGNRKLPWWAVGFSGVAIMLVVGGLLSPCHSGPAPASGAEKAESGVRREATWR